MKVYLAYMKYPEVNNDLQVLVGAFYSKEKAAQALGNPILKWCIDPNKWVGNNATLIHRVEVQ